MDINLFNVPNQYRSRIKAVVEDFAQNHHLNPQSSLNITFLTKNKVRSLNRKYRKVDNPTDVLSFPIWKNLDEIPELGEVALGDIFICLEMTDIEKQLANLIKHSLDHLVGKHH